MPTQDGMSLKSTRSDHVTLSFPRRLMADEEICATADRYKVSDVQLTAITAAILKAGGANLEDFSLSRSTVYRNRILNRYKISETYMEEFMRDAPEFLILHWDSKLMKNVSGIKANEKMDALAVLVTGTPSFEEGNWIISD